MFSEFSDIPWAPVGAETCHYHLPLLTVFILSPVDMSDMESVEFF